MATFSAALSDKKHCLKHCQWEETGTGKKFLVQEKGASLALEADREPGLWRGSGRNKGYYSWSVWAGWELVKKRTGAGGQGALRRERELKKF